MFDISVLQECYVYCNVEFAMKLVVRLFLFLAVVIIFFYAIINVLPRSMQLKLDDTVMELSHVREFKASPKHLFPTDSTFKESEEGDCLINGDSEMKSLSRNCGCEPNDEQLNTCCRHHLRKLLKEVFSEMIANDIPFILTDGAVEGWFKNEKLLPSDEDINAGIPYSYWYSEKFRSALKRLASRGFCIWYREDLWIKIWSSVMPVDIRPWSVIYDDLYFAGGDARNPYRVSDILPKKTGELDGIKVFLPNHPYKYLSHLNGVPPADPMLPFVPNAEDYIPPDPTFQETEKGDCINNGDAEMKGISSTCGCAPVNDTTFVHPCCMRHLQNLVKAVYIEMVKENIPLILIGGALIGWYRNKKLVPYDKDIDAELHVKYWKSANFSRALANLATQGLCVWHREQQWLKVWSGPMGFDVFAFNDIGDKIYFWSPDGMNNPYETWEVYPVRTDVLEGQEVYLPNKVKQFNDRCYGEGRWMTPLH